jgi:uncharacterized protein (TIGR02145 family)
MKLIIVIVFLLFNLLFGYTQCGIDSIQDYDGNWYNTVLIGNQCWLAENLSVTHYADGSPIKQVKCLSKWYNLEISEKTYCYYNNDSLHYATNYGALYTWQAVMNGATYDTASVIQGICPEGWHLPSDDEWDQLNDWITNNNNYENVAKVLKATNNWARDNEGIDDYGFTALPAGYRNPDGSFLMLGYETYYWSSLEKDKNTAWVRHLSFNSERLIRYAVNKINGLSVRCIKNKMTR